MKPVLAAVMIGFFSTASAPYTSLQHGCVVATIDALSDEVTIDWRCVSATAENYKLRRSTGTVDAFAFVLELLRNGSAIAK